MMTIRALESSDWAALWPILRDIYAKGDTYAFPPDASEEEAFAAWTKTPLSTFVACDRDGRVLGAYYIKPNQLGHGDHVANCGYVVSEVARGQGIAALMCEHSQRVALKLGFSAMQFNFVVSTNLGAVRLWQKLGFEIVGTLPRAFRHPVHGLVDAFVMYKWLLG